MQIKYIDLSYANVLFTFVLLFNKKNIINNNGK